MDLGLVTFECMNGTVYRGSVELDIDGEAADDHQEGLLAYPSMGSRLAIGAIWNDGNGSNAGHVRVYELDSFASFLTLNDTLYGNPGDHFGGSVAIDADGSRLAIGSPKWTVGAGLGRESRFLQSISPSIMECCRCIGNKWSWFFRIWFGIRRNAQGDRLVSRALYLDDLGGVNAGATVVYEEVGGGTWSQIGSDLRGEDFRRWRKNNSRN